MDETLIVRVCDVTDRIYNFNEYMYRIVTCEVETDTPFDTLIPIDINVVSGDIISIEKCKLVRIDYESNDIITAVRIDKLEVVPADTSISKYFNIPFIGMVKRQADMHPTTYGPDKTKFFKVQLQMRDADKKTFIVYLLGFDGKATLLDSFDRFKIITGVATLKHRRGKPGHELALVSAEEYKK